MKFFFDPKLSLQGWNLALHSPKKNGKPQAEDGLLMSSECGGKLADNDREEDVSVWLRKRTLLAFTVFFGALAASLILLWRLDIAMGGFQTTITSNHYSLTYGPTALLVIVVSLWRQVDYNAKVLQPWRAMESGYQLAGRSVLLDCLSPLQITSFIKAVRLGHLPVVVSITGFATIKGIVLASTALLTLRDTDATKPVSIRFANKFDGSSFWDPIRQESDIEYYSYDGVSSAPVDAFAGYLSRLTPLLDGMTANGMVAQSFEPIDTITYSELSAEVDVFSSSYDCQIAEATFEYSNVDDQWQTVKLTSPGCFATLQDFNSGPGVTGLCRDEDGTVGCLDHLVPSRVDCSTGTLPSGSISGGDRIHATSEAGGHTDESASHQIGYALVVSNKTFTTVKTTTGAQRKGWDVHNYAAVICRPGCGVERRLLTIAEHNRLDDANLQEQDWFPSMTALQLGEVVWSALRHADSITTNQTIRDPLFYILSLGRDNYYRTGSESPLSTLIDIPYLRPTAVRMFNGIASALMAQTYMSAADVAGEGTATYARRQLRTTPAALWIMVAGSCVMSGLALAMIRFRPARGLRKADRLAFDALVLASSPDLQKLMHGSGHSRTSELKNRFVHQTFRMNDGNSHCIEAMHAVSVRTVSAALAPERITSWVPLVAKYPMVAITLLSPLMCILILEVLSLFEKRDEEIFDITGLGKATTYLPRYLTAALMLLIATAFNNFDFTISAYAPYTLLQRATAVNSQSLSFQLLGSIPVVALWRSTRNRHLPSALSNSIAMLGSILTIVSSGLWVIEQNIPADLPASGIIVNQFAPNWNRSESGDGGAGMQLAQVLRGSADMSKTTYNETIFPEISYIRWSAATEGDIEQGTSNFTFDLIGLRPELSCEIIEPVNLRLLTHAQPDGTNATGIGVTAVLPDICHRGGPNGNESTAFFHIPLNPISSEGYIADVYDLHMGPFNSSNTLGWGEPTVFDNDGTELAIPATAQIQDNPGGCPSLAFYFGKARANQTTVDDINILVCSQKLRQIKAKAIYDEWTASLETILFPPANESSPAVYLTNGTANITTFPYRIQNHLQNLALFPVENSTDTGFLYGIFNNIIYGPSKIPKESLTGRANAPNLIKALNTLYNQYMLLVLDMRLKQPAFDNLERYEDINRPAGPDDVELADDDPRVVHGTALILRTKVFIDSTSKIVLQCLLGVMSLGGAIVYWQSWAALRGGLLPRSPYTVASRLGFFVEGGVVQRLLKERGQENGDGVQFSTELDQVDGTGKVPSAVTSFVHDGAEDDPRFKADYVGEQQRTWGGRRERGTQRYQHVHTTTE